MCRLIDDIALFLESNGFVCSRQMRHDFDVICTRTLDGNHSRMILPLEITAVTQEEAEVKSEEALYAVRMISREAGYPLIIVEDRWKRQRAMMQARIMAHLELFSQAYARNCEVKRIDKTEAKAFLSANHSYGYAACRYCYGLFLKRHTGHIAEEIKAIDSSRDGDIGRLIAVATFSNARKWVKEGHEIRSYEWTRYASLPDMRVNGGMGKLLKAFIKEVHPDDIMSYADLEWSEGHVYEALGFKAESGKDAVDFSIDGHTWERYPIKSRKSGMAGNLFFRNFGSRKFRLKITDYK